MSPKIQQTYEQYWKLTLEYTNIHGGKFLGTLRMIVDFIDQNQGKEYSEEVNKRLQEEVYQVYPKKDMGSVRKSINQFVKLGFVNYHLRSYHEDARSFLEAQTTRRRESIFSKIVYTSSSFNRSVDTDSQKREINFLIKTLENVGKLHKEDIAGLMTVDIDKHEDGDLLKEELDKAKKHAKDIKFISRKYNQVSYLCNLLRKLDDVVFVNDYLYFEEDARVLFGDEKVENKKQRDPYLHRIYKNQLKEESVEVVGKIRCMVEELDYPSLVASHIKPFIDSSDKEAYDPNNGLLLSRNMDALFDQGHVSFDNEGKILLSTQLSEEVKEHLREECVKEDFVSDERREYLQYHREKVFSG